jgi:hypothetical protein
MLKNTMKEDKIHFFSHKTHTSLELPVGWEESSESETSVTYAYSLDEAQDTVDFTRSPSGQNPDPILAVQIFALPHPDHSASEKAATAFLNQRQSLITLIQRDTKHIDGYNAVSMIFTALDADYPGESYQHHCFVTVDNVLFSFSAACPASIQSLFAPVFDEALDSIRFIFFSK